MRKHKILFKPLTIIVPDERESLFKKLKKQKDKLDLIIDNPDIDMKLQLKAMNTSVKLVKTMVSLLKTAKEEQLDAEIEGLRKIVEKELAKAKRRRLERSVAH